MTSKILVVDDEKDIVKAEEIYLKSAGYETIHAYSGMDALLLMEKEEVDLLLIDVMMPQMDGITLTREIRKKWCTPIIIVSAKSESVDKVDGLNAGADDYITKPFDAEELIARVTSCLRRQQMLLSRENNNPVYDAGRIRLDIQKKEVRVDNEIVKLTPYEYGILKLLMSEKGRVFSSDEIYTSVWDAPAFDVKKVISVHISRLRDKLEINPRKPDWIVSVYGMGYKIEDHERNN